MDRRIFEKNHPWWDVDICQNEFKNGSLPGAVRIPIVQGLLDIVEPAQCVETVLFVVIDRRFIAQTTPDRMGISVYLNVKRIVIHGITAVRCHSSVSSTHL